MSEKVILKMSFLKELEKRNIEWTECKLMTFQNSTFHSCLFSKDSNQYQF